MNTREFPWIGLVFATLMGVLIFLADSPGTIPRRVVVGLRIAAVILLALFVALI